MLYQLDHDLANTDGWQQKLVDQHELKGHQTFVLLLWINLVSLTILLNEQVLTYCINWFQEK